mgnify:CR=1 FL=1
MTCRFWGCALTSSIAVLAAAASGQGLLYENGPIVTHPGGGPGGTDYSAVQTRIGQQTSGWSVRGQVGDRIADEFTIPDGQVWLTESVSLYTMVGDDPDLLQFMGVQIWDGAPNRPDSSLVWGDIDDNILTDNALPGIYRGNDIEPRFESPVTRSSGEMSAVLGPGTYWIEFSVDTSEFDSPPALIPVNILGERGKPDANALWHRQGAWSALVDLNLDVGPVPQDIAFDIHGAIVPAPGTATLILAAGAFACRRSRPTR